MVRSLWSIVEANSWQLETVGSGWEALESVQAGTTPDLLLLDLPRGMRIACTSCVGWGGVPAGSNSQLSCRETTFARPFPEGSAASLESTRERLRSARGLGMDNTDG